MRVVSVWLGRVLGATFLFCSLAGPASAHGTRGSGGPITQNTYINGYAYAQLSKPADAAVFNALVVGGVQFAASVEFESAADHKIEVTNGWPSASIPAQYRWDFDITVTGGAIGGNFSTVDSKQSTGHAAGAWVSVSIPPSTTISTPANCKGTRLLLPGQYTATANTELEFPNNLFTGAAHNHAFQVN